jgi:phosphatidylinositol glycan class A protein
VGAVHISQTLGPFLHCCDKVIAISDVQKENLRARMKISSNVTIVPNGINPGVFCPAEVSPPNYPTIVAVTRFERRRGGEMLPEIVKQVCQKHTTARWILVGGGSMLEDVRNLIGRLGLTKRVTFLGSVHHEEIPAILKTGHFFVNCSLIDAFCVSIVEAAACGLFVISTDVGGIPEVLPEKTRILCPPSANVLTDAILRAIDEKSQFHAECAQAHYQELKEKFSWESVASQLLRIYRTEVAPNPFFYELTKHYRFLHTCIALIYFTSLYILVWFVKLCCS